MTIKEHIRVDFRDSVLFDASRTLPEGSVFRRRSSLGGFPVEGGSVQQYTVKDDGLEGEAIPQEEMDAYIFSGGTAEVHPFPVRLEAEEINRPGSQIYTQKRIGPVTIWRKVIHKK